MTLFLIAMLVIIVLVLMEVPVAFAFGIGAVFFAYTTGNDISAVSKSECNTVNELMPSHYRSTPSLCS